MAETPTPDGRVVVVGTPIGNLGDLSPRAVAALEGADVVACEDTRRSGRLLQHAGVPGKRLVRLDDHTEAAVTADLVARAAAGDRVALVSDAGLPGLSDPGAVLLAAAWSAGVAVEVVPGPFAAAVGLVGSGMLEPSGRFCFEGFLPRKGPARRTRIAALVGEERTTVLYEAPHRLRSTLEDLRDALGADRRVALCRELTKLHEETWRGSLGDAVARCAEVEPRGEFVVVLAGAEPPPDATDDELRRSLDRELETGASRRDAAATVAARFDVAPNRVKRLLSG
ncbi:MAG TPA: 16S rRNA (cytidine(1402)-2'-O)-methyltransferase [Microthrixaceae bacterium]|nr:16S rRNA (cytidine(1402)-2'-O)-methyltransferase [Microthrixaceae bacterium]HNJ68476.1 16S rRNA (cytidine(1402)-2'-O)-methyltransferase [Microthrixaceae bacterium]HNL48086.1 16S rRNA (cytidine(1402)-2'-O)-methyltransferase [Microthrixaceae bacterium]HNO44814.1 16S rRNA (cytidine(1402)-2'-O)-methyltransferase [Microthrixaceae bacterium]